MVVRFKGFVVGEEAFMVYCPTCRTKVMHHYNGQALPLDDPGFEGMDIEKYQKTSLYTCLGECGSTTSIEGTMTDMTLREAKERLAA